MADFQFRRLEQHRVGGTSDRMQLAVPLPKSASGKVHRFCPAPDCVPNIFQFGDAEGAGAIAPERLHLIRRQPASPGTTCPYCGHDGEDTDFTWRDDIEAVKQYIAWAAREDVADAVAGMFENLGRQHNNGGFLSIRVTTTRQRTRPPFVWREDLLRDLTCGVCRRRYGVYTIALFCPACGARNLHGHFQREVDLVNQQVELAEQVGGEGRQELAYRLLGNAHEDVLTAFETYLKVVYRFLVKQRLPQEAPVLCAKKAIGNNFQNIERGQKLFARLGIDPYDGLAAADLTFLRLNIEKRHVVGHNLSMVDEAYAAAAGSEQPGQTVRLLAEEIERFALLCGQVVVRLEEGCPEFLPPTTAAST